MQINNKRFGPKELKGSFNALLQREFIDAKTVTSGGSKELIWFVTTAGKNTLSKLDQKDVLRKL